MGSRRALARALLALAVALPLALACVVPPDSCIAPKCAALPNFYPNPSWNYSNPAIWDHPNLRGVAFYRGVFNKRRGNSAPRADTQERWEQLRDNGLIVNLEKFPLEQPFLIAAPVQSSLRSCCDICRTQQGCVLYLWRPRNTTFNFRLDRSDAGMCHLLRGGVYTKDGPFDPITGVNYGTPNGSTNSWQSDSNRRNRNPMGYVGGFCNPNPNVVDDPHFTGAHGTRFEFNGDLDRTYCLVTDERLHVNIKLKGYRDTRTVGATVGADGTAIRSWIEEVGFLWKDEDGFSHSLHLAARPGKEQNRGERGFLQSAFLDGDVMEIPDQKDETFQAGEMTFTFLGTTKKGPFDVDNYMLSVGQQLRVKISLRVAHPLLQTEDEAHAHFNLMFDSFTATERVHGVLGQTYRNTVSQIVKAVEYSMLNKLLGVPIQADGATGQGFLDGAVADYVASGVTLPDCKVSSYL